ncbi:MAG: Nudix family hydrolase [Pseudomonadota bacterium]|nr:Nudix family hydrolase [Pseudomonadota bacterium]
MRRIHVVAAVIEHDGKVLIARRPQHLYQGGKWEFPGGKVEPGEAPMAALARELKEELNLELAQAQPLIKIAHDYPDKQVLLDVWRVTDFAGTAEGMEGQSVRWVEREQLPDYEFPAANGPIVTAARLPRHYVISPPNITQAEPLLRQWQQLLERGERLFQLRCKQINDRALATLVEQLQPMIERFDAQVLVNSDMPTWVQSRFQGVHLTAAALRAMEPGREVGKRPDMPWLAASCHNREELEQAQGLGVDFVTLSPLRVTASHPGQPPLSRQDFERWVLGANVPVFALGGVGPGDRSEVAALGAQGVAGISAFWGSV